MSLAKIQKEEIFKQFGKSEKDTGTTEGQIALFTHRIKHLSNHLESNRKDFNTERSLVRLVGKRKRLLNYQFAIVKAISMLLALRFYSFRDYQVLKSASNAPVK